MLTALAADQTPVVGACASSSLLDLELDHTPLLRVSETPHVLGEALIATSTEPTAISTHMADIIARRLSDPSLREALMSFALSSAVSRTWVLVSPISESMLEAIASLAGILAPKHIAPRIDDRPRSMTTPASPKTQDPIPAISAVTDLTQWLGMTEEAVAEYAGFSRRNLSNWRNGLGIYPKTVRGLFEIHALVGGLIRRLGTGTIGWFDQVEGGSTRLELLKTAEGRTRLHQLAQSLLFERVHTEPLAAEFEEAAASEQFLAPRLPNEGFLRSPRRRRRQE